MNNWESFIETEKQKPYYKELARFINSEYREHTIYPAKENIFKALTDPQSLSDREYFLALSTAIKTYVYQDLKENAYQQYLIEIGVDYSTPAYIEQVLWF